MFIHASADLPMRRCVYTQACWDFATDCHNYTGHNYIGQNYIGHNYIGHDYTQACWDLAADLNTEVGCAGPARTHALTDAHTRARARAHAFV